MVVGGGARRQRGIDQRVVVGPVAVPGADLEAGVQPFALAAVLPGSGAALLPERHLGDVPVEDDGTVALIPGLKDDAGKFLADPPGCGLGEVVDPDRGAVGGFLLAHLDGEGNAQFPKLQRAALLGPDEQRAPAQPLAALIAAFPATACCLSHDQPPRTAGPRPARAYPGRAARPREQERAPRAPDTHTAQAGRTPPPAGCRKRGDALGVGHVEQPAAFGRVHPADGKQQLAARQNDAEPLRLRGQGNDITHCRTHFGCIFKAMQNVTSRGRPASGPCSPSRRSWRGSGACRVRPGPLSPASSR